MTLLSSGNISNLHHDNNAIIENAIIKYSYDYFENAIYVKDKEIIIDCTK